MAGEKSELRVSECYRLMMFFEENYCEFNDEDLEIGKELIYRIKKSLKEYNRNNKAIFIPVFIGIREYNWIIKYKFIDIFQTKNEKRLNTFKAIIWFILICFIYGFIVSIFN